MRTVVTIYYHAYLQQYGEYLDLKKMHAQPIIQSWMCAEKMDLKYLSGQKDRRATILNQIKYNMKAGNVQRDHQKMYYIVFILNKL